MDQVKPQSSPERPMAHTRIAAFGMLLAYGALTRFGVSVASLGYVTFFLLSVALLVSIHVRPAMSGGRTVISIFADVAAVTFALFLVDAAGPTVVGLYLFLAIACGYRYSTRYLLLSQWLSIGALVLVMSVVPWWHQNWIVGAGWLITMFVIPMYVRIIPNERSSAFSER